MKSELHFHDDRPGVRIEQWLAHRPEKVWRAITQPKHLERWYAPGCPWEIPALEVGATVKFYNTETEILRATIEIVDPPWEFKLRWQPEPDYPATSLVTHFVLEPEAGGTRVTLTETGYETLPDLVRRQRVQQTTEGYTLSLGILKTYLELGS